MTTHILHTDGAARGNPGPAGIGIVLQGPGGEIVAEVAEGIGWATNNVAEYRALIEGLELALADGADRLVVYSDSLLLVEQLRGNYKVKNKGLKPLHARASELAHRFTEVNFEVVPREKNSGADRLANRGIDEWLLENPEFEPPDPDQGELF